MKIRSSAPGRICLYGEHQDYMGFPVIAAAIDLRITIEGQVSEGAEVMLELSDLNETIRFSTEHFAYTREKDYFKSAIKVLKNQRLFQKKKIHGRVYSNIPIQAGTSSSSALVVAWIGFLLRISGMGSSDVISTEQIGELAYLAEVEEFSESGGRMDQYCSAIGGIVHIDFHDPIRTTSLPPGVKKFVLGDSLQPKNTQKTLKRIRTGQENGLKALKQFLESDGFQINYDEAQPYFNRVSAEYRPYLRGVLKNRHITAQAREELQKIPPDPIKLASLMNQHHEVLRNDLNISTPKIENMIESSMKAGALAAKINGSGEGGCMFAFCPGRQEQVAEAIKSSGGTPYIINIGKGLDVKLEE